MLEPRRGVAVVVDVEHRDVQHEARRRRAVPVLFSGLEEDAVAGRISSTWPPRFWQRPMPSRTKIVWPFGCVCHAVRAPGVKWTALALTRDVADGTATASM